MIYCKNTIKDKEIFHECEIICPKVITSKYIKWKLMEHKEEINSQLQCGILMESDKGLDLKKRYQ